MRIIGTYNIDPSAPASLVSTTRFDYGMTPPHSDEFILGFERELMTDFSVGVNYSYRKYSDLLETRAEHHQGQGDFFTQADYKLAGTTQGVNCGADAAANKPTVPGRYEICDPNGNLLRTITAPVRNIYDLKNPNDPPTFFVVRNTPDYSQRFSGLELTATKRLSHNWMLRGNLSWNDWKEHCGAASIADPTPVATTTGTAGCPGGQVVARSAGSGAFADVFINSKWSFNVTGLYQLPWDFNVGASLTGRQGYPRPFQEEVTTSTGGTNNVILGPVGSTRFDNVYELDLRAAKDFRFFNRVGVTISADLFNVPNKRTILQRNTDLSLSNADYITEIQSPRVWRFGAKVSF
jgi:hypothetical protein